MMFHETTLTTAAWMIGTSGVLICYASISFLYVTYGERVTARRIILCLCAIVVGYLMILSGTELGARAKEWGRHSEQAAEVER